MRRIISYQPTIGETALLILGDVVEGALKTFYPHPYYHAYCRHAHPRSLYKAIRNLERRNLVAAKSRGRGEEWSLSGAGKRRLALLRMKLAYAKARKWDGKWRLIIFDIPERRRSRRDFLRQELRALGFHQLQKSAWVSPYSLPPEFTEIFLELAVGKGFRVVTADKIEGDDDLRSIFFPAVR